MDVIANRLLRSTAPAVKVMAALVIVIALTVILKEGQDIFIPLVLGILLAFALAPISNFVERRLRLGRPVAVLVCILLALGVIAGTGIVVYRQMSELAADLPNYRKTIREKVKVIADEASADGPFTRATEVLSDILIEVAPDSVETNGTEVKTKTQTVVLAERKSAMTKFSEFIGPMVHPVAMAVAMLLLSAFLLAGREDIRNRFIRMAGEGDIQRTTAALDESARRVGRQLLEQVALNGGFGLVVGAGLWAIGLPSPFLWGILAGIMRFVPFVGPLLGILPPLLIAFAYDPTWNSFWWTLGLFLAVEPVTGNVLEPMLYGKSSGLSPVALVLAALVWAYIWGPIGLVLSAPLTIFIVVMSRHIPALGFIDTALGDRPVLKPHEMFYQRILAGDPGEARDQATQFLKQRSLPTFYDRIALEALRRAHHDIVRGTVSGDRLKKMTSAATDFVRLMENVPMNKRVRMSVEAEAAAAEIGPDLQITRERLNENDLAAEWNGKGAVAVIHGDHPLDEAAGRMLAQVVSHHGISARAMDGKTAAAAGDAEIAAAQMVCLSFVEPLSTLHLRAAIRQIHRRKPGAQVMLCIWQEGDRTLIDGLRRSLHVRDIATTTTDALKIISRKARRKGV